MGKHLEIYILTRLYSYVASLTLFPRNVALLGAIGNRRFPLLYKDTKPMWTYQRLE